MHMAQWSPLPSCANSSYFVYKIKLPITYNNLYRITFITSTALQQGYYASVGGAPEAYSSLFICVCVCVFHSICYQHSVSLAKKLSTDMSNAGRMRHLLSFELIDFLTRSFVLHLWRDLFTLTTVSSNQSQAKTNLLLADCLSTWLLYFCATNQVVA